jgi:hypothetical protein
MTTLIFHGIIAIIKIIIIILLSTVFLYILFVRFFCLLRTRAQFAIGFGAVQFAHK